MVETVIIDMPKVEELTDNPGGVSPVRERFTDRFKVSNILRKVADLTLEIVFPMNDSNRRRNEIMVLGLVGGTIAGTTLGLVANIDTSALVDNPYGSMFIGALAGSLVGRSLAVHYSRVAVKDCLE